MRRPARRGRARRLINTEPSSVVRGKTIEIASHRSSLRQSLEELRTSTDHDFSVVPLRVRYRWVAIAALGMLLVVAVTSLSWWVGDTSSRPNRHNLIVAEKTRVRGSEPNLAKEYSPTSSMVDSLAFASQLRPWFREVYRQGGDEQLESVAEAIELEHFKPEFPSYTMGGRIDEVYVVGSPQLATVDITYTSGMAFRASVNGSKADFARRIRETRQGGFLAPVLEPEEMPYLVGLSDTVGLMWPAAYDYTIAKVTAPVISWWSNGIDYDVTTGKHDFGADDAAALRELRKIAESFSGQTRVPAPGEKISVPPSYVDIETARKATGFKFRAPEYTAGGTVTDVYKRMKDNFAYFSYSNGLQISVDAGGKEPRDAVSEYDSYEEALAAYRKGSPEIEEQGVEAVPVDIAGNKGLLIVRKDRQILMPPDSTGDPSYVFPSLLWWEGKTTYSLIIDNEKAFTPDIEAGIRELLKIARSMYE